MNNSVKLLITMAALSILTACGSDTTANQKPPANAPNGSPTDVKVSPVVSNNNTKVAVVLKEMTIDLSSKTIPAGKVDFVISNQGKFPHEFVVFKTDLSIDKLPMKDDKLDEDAKELKNMADTGEEDLKAGASKTITANLTPGKYVAICNVGKHYMKGMKIAFIVK